MPLTEMNTVELRNVLRGEIDALSRNVLIAVLTLLQSQAIPAVEASQKGIPWPDDDDVRVVPGITPLSREEIYDRM
jgi:hypothetical protein